MAVVRACTAPGVNNAWRDVQSTYSLPIYCCSTAGKSHLIGPYHQTKCALHMAALYGYYLWDKRKDGQVNSECVLRASALLASRLTSERMCCKTLPGWSKCSGCPFGKSVLIYHLLTCLYGRSDPSPFLSLFPPLSCVNWWHWASSAAPGVLRMHNMNASVYTWAMTKSTLKVILAYYNS